MFLPQNYKNQTIPARVIAKNVGDPFFETQCIYTAMQQKVEHIYFMQIFAQSVSSVRRLILT